MSATGLVAEMWCFVDTIRKTIDMVARHATACKSMRQQKTRTPYERGGL
jgi:hypothetical protein